MTQAELEATLEGFEGLVKETASQIIAQGVELEFDDVRQLLRVKVWQAVLTFDEKKAAAGKRLGQQRDRLGRTPMQRFVFMCVTNMRKDIEKRPRRFNRSVDFLRDNNAYDGGASPEYTSTGRAEKFDAKYLSVDAELVFAQIEGSEDDLPLDDLTPTERQVVMLRLEGRHLFEIDLELGLSRAQRERVMESVKQKLGELRPEGSQRTAPTPPLPRAAPRSARARTVLAA